MNKTAVILVGLATLIAPAIPSLAQGDDGRSGEAGCAAGTFEGEHWTFAIDPELPGLADVTLNRSDTRLADAIQLPGDELDCRVEDDRVRLSTDASELRVRDRAELRLGIATEENASAAIQLASGVSVEDAAEDEGEDRYRLTPADGPTLVLNGENVTRDGGALTVTGDAQLFRDPTTRGDDSADGSEDERSQEDRGDREGGGPVAADRNGSSEDDRRERGDDRRERGPPEDRGRQRASVSEGTYDVGAAQLQLANDTIRELGWRNATLFRTVEVPGLTPAEERRQGPQLRLEGEDARVRLAAAGGLMARMEADAGLEARLAEEVETRRDGDHVFLSTDNLLVVVEGEDLSLEDRNLTADELRLHARSPQHHEGPVWRGQDVQAQAVELPYLFEGRHVAFELTEDGLTNVSIHGTPVGDVTFDPVTVDELEREGANLDVEGETFELRLQDTPAVQLRLEAANLSADLPNRTTLPSGAQVHTQVEDDELRLRVDRPADALANETSVEHQPATESVERTEGPQPGLATRTDEGRLGVESSSPSTITTSFDGDEVDENVSVQLGLARAMLIDDTNGNNRVDVGEPALAERPLANGTAQVEGDELVHRFALWSGNLTVTVEPGDETAKVTYVAENLSAPPGTLFVLETNVQAPPDANLTPTDTGVVVENGTMSAEYSATGPVTVDGEEAWAQRSIFVDGDDRVRVLVAYPAGDDIEHDPTVAVQSSATEVAQRLAASPYAILVGAGLAGVLVAGTVMYRQHRRPPRP